MNGNQEGGSYSYKDFPLDMNHIENQFDSHGKNAHELHDSIANMENALAHLLDEQTNVLKKHAHQWSDKQISHYTGMIEDTLKKIILKEIVMLLLLDEDCKPKKKKHHKDCKCEDHDHCPDHCEHHDHHNDHKNDKHCKKCNDHHHHDSCKCNCKCQHSCCYCSRKECKSHSKNNKHCHCFSW